MARNLIEIYRDHVKGTISFQARTGALAAAQLVTRNIEDTLDTLRLRIEEPAKRRVALSGIGESLGVSPSRGFPSQRLASAFQGVEQCPI